MSLESTEKHLDKFKFTIEQAKDFIEANILNPMLIFDTAQEYGVTTEMLSDISGYPIDVVKAYFTNANLDLITEELDYTKILINSNLGSLESLVATNEREGILSNTILRNLVASKLDSSDDYEYFFYPIYPHQADDNIYDAEELGVSNLTDVPPATAESLESLFYGTLMNIFSRLDSVELEGISKSSNKESPEYQSFLISALSSPSTFPRDDENLKNLVVDEAIYTIRNYWIGDDPDTGITQYRNGLFDFGLLGNI